jgi:hypothetical protein
MCTGTGTDVARIHATVPVASPLDSFFLLPILFACVPVPAPISNIVPVPVTALTGTYVPVPAASYHQDHIYL